MTVAIDLVDHWAEELTSVLPALHDVQVHKYAPLSIEALMADGRKHLAIWPVSNVPSEQPTPFAQGFTATTGSLNIQYDFIVLYWEPSAEGEFLKTEESAAKDFLALGEDIRDRFLVESNRTLTTDSGLVWRTDWTATQYDIGGQQAPAMVRSLVIGFSAQVAFDRTP
jgi:hypothetical protein